MEDDKKKKVEEIDALRAQGMHQREAAKRVGLNWRTYYTIKKRMSKEGDDKVMVYPSGILPTSSNKSEKRAYIYSGKYRKNKSQPSKQKLCVIMGSPDEIADILGRIFVNNAMDKLKMYSSGGLLTYIRTGSRIDLQIIEQIPRSFDGGKMNWEKAARLALEKKLGRNTPKNL